MPPFRRSLICLAALAGLSACHRDANVQKLEAANPTANDFTSSLASEYQAYAQAEAEQGYKTSADYYAGKGLKALHGEAVPPEPVNPALPAATREKLTTSRQLLTSLLTDDLEHVVPQKTARAQLLFDCWQNQAGRETAQGGQTPLTNKTAALCDQGFTASITELHEVADSFSSAHDINEGVHFSRQSAALDEKAQAGIAALAAKIARLPHGLAYSAELDGHADCYRQPDKHLSAERIAAVREALVGAGVSADHIIVKEGGEKAVVLSSDDEVDAAGRNVVDITVRGKAIPPEQKAAP